MEDGMVRTKSYSGMGKVFRREVSKGGEGERERESERVRERESMNERERQR